MARAGVVATLLPGAFYFVRETRLPPIDNLRGAGVPIALASDCNLYVVRSFETAGLRI